MSRGVLVVLLAVFAVAACAEEANVFSTIAPDGSSFRFDYSFQQGVNGWLKLHRTSASWHIARLTCRLEGGRLASPLNHEFLGTMQRLLETSNLKSIFTGIHGMSIGTDYFSVEGIHINQMPLQWEGLTKPTNQSRRCLAFNEQGRVFEVSCENEKPFFCYKPREGTIRMNDCGTTDSAYVRNYTTGSCYKFYNHRATWYQAYTTCAADGGHLAIINSAAEAEVLSLLSRGHGDYVYVGFFNWFRDDSFDIGRWMTVDDKTLPEAGYAGWMSNQPDNRGGNEFCGSIGWNRNNVGLNDYACDNLVPFICEIERPRVPIWW